MNKFPSYAEHQGLYNVARKEGDAKGRLQRSSAVIRSADFLPRLTWKESYEVFQATRRAVVTYGKIGGMTKKELEKYYEFCVIDEMPDRTAAIELPDFKDVTAAFIEGLQRDVLKDRPLWRILLAGEVPETFIVIYPKVVRLAGLPASADWRSHLDAVVKKEIELRNKREGPERRQHEWLRRTLPKEMTKLADKGLRIVAAFDNWRGDSRTVTLWILYREPTDRYRAFRITHPKDCAVGFGSAAVQPDGRFGSQFAWDSSEVQLEQWILPPGYKGKIVFEELGPKETVLGEWCFTTDSLKIIKDEDLKKGK